MGNGVNGRFAPVAIECDLLGMDLNSMMASFFFGLLGTAMCCFAKKAGRSIPMACGVALMVLPSFVPGVGAMILLCLVISAVPFVVTA